MCAETELATNQLQTKTNTLQATSGLKKVQKQACPTAEQMSWYPADQSYAAGVDFISLGGGWQQTEGPRPPAWGKRHTNMLWYHTIHVKLCTLWVVTEAGPVNPHYNSPGSRRWARDAVGH